MKTIWFILLCALACGGGSKSESPAGSAAPPARAGEGEPCTNQEVQLDCPDGQIDACEKALAAPMPDAGETGTMMAVEEGRMGRLGRAGNHRCVAK